MKKSLKEIHKLCLAESKKKDHEYNISEIAINTLGYNLIKEKKIKEALELFEINTELYPNSSNVFDSYGECLLLMGKEKEGMAAYKKSLELDPENTNADNVLKKYNYK
jgi:tetratricopeptide (TPR) repeat protein